LTAIDTEKIEIKIMGM